MNNIIQELEYLMNQKTDSCTVRRNEGDDLNNFMSPRIAAAKSNVIIMQSFDSIIDEAKKNTLRTTLL